MLVLIYLLLSSLFGVISEPVDDQDYVDQCMPTLADRCFKGVMKSIECKMKMANPKSCVDVLDFCSMMEDTLNCAADIIDTDCKAEDGQINFDSWLTGLRSINTRVCNATGGFFKGMVSLDFAFFLVATAAKSYCWEDGYDLTRTPCFNIDDFVECVEDITKVTHVVDLLQVNLNTYECNRFLIALPTCNIRANAAQNVCNMPQEMINDLIHTFFTHSPCGQTCPLYSNTSILSSYVQLIVIFQALLVVFFN